jgi:hypothetical protein
MREHISVANMAINSAITTGTVLYMLALDMKDDFGSVSHNQLRSNLQGNNQCKPIREMIMNGNDRATVKIVTLDGTTEIILIKRGGKQNSSLRPVLLDIWVFPLREKLNSWNLRGLGTIGMQ